MVAKRKATKRQKTGIAGAPLDKGFPSFLEYFTYDLEKKDYVEIIKQYVKENYTEEEARCIFMNPEYTYGIFPALAAGIQWVKFGLELPESYSHVFDHIKTMMEPLIEKGSEQVRAEVKKTSRVLTPHQKLYNKLCKTVFPEIDSIEENKEINLYDLFKIHELKAAAVEPVKRYIYEQYEVYQDAYNGSCDQAVEGYGHLGKPKLKKRMEAYSQMLKDLESIRSSSKAQKPSRVKKTKSAEKQVAKVQYQKESKEYKITSINPVMIVGATKLYTFNTKTRKLAYYETDAVDGFELSGTSIKNYDPELSKQLTLRKPEEVLSVILQKTARQIAKHLETLSTKMQAPRGRLGVDTVLLRVL